jgi:uncharacterized membrane protein YczE
MHQLPVGSNFPGLVFAVGCALIFLFAIPALWYVLVAAIVVGLVIAAMLQLIHPSHDRHENPRDSAIPHIYPR